MSCKFIFFLFPLKRIISSWNLLCLEKKILFDFSLSNECTIFILLVIVIFKATNARYARATNHNAN
uniref:Hypothetical secreted peptide n=1 Tax=Triatoma matogrossensis TaxID=162370 RepID=E2J7C8_9HEMI